MILVTVGMHNQPFDRLIKTADEMATLVDESIIIQRGSSDFTPTFCTYFDFTDAAQMQILLSESRVMVSHAGAGSILNALRAGKPAVIVPRLKRFQEVFDDHQLELAEALAQQRKIVVVTNLSPETLWQAIISTKYLNCNTLEDHSLQIALSGWLEKHANQTKLRRSS